MNKFAFDLGTAVGLEKLAISGAEWKYYAASSGIGGIGGGLIGAMAGDLSGGNVGMHAAAGAGIGAVAQPLIMYALLARNKHAARAQRDALIAKGRLSAQDKRNKAFLDQLHRGGELDD